MRTQAAGPEAAERVDKPASFVAFYESRYVWAARLAYVLCGSDVRSEDIAQDAFLAMEGQYPQILNPDAYLRTAITRLSIDYHRRERTRRAALPALRRDLAVSAEHHELFDVLQRLPHRQRVVLVMRFWLGLSFPEIAEILGCRLSTTKSQARRGLASLREALEEDR